MDACCGAITERCTCLRTKLGAGICAGVSIFVGIIFLFIAFFAPSMTVAGIIILLIIAIILIGGGLSILVWIGIMKCCCRT
jgi:hypothetical protein